MLIPVYNPETTEYEKSYLANNYSAGVTTIVVKNTDRFAANQRIMLGAMGLEKTEIVTVQAVVDSTSLTVSATSFSHLSNDPVIVMQFDQVKYYRSTTGSSGAYVSLTTVALDVDNENLQTIYDDTTGLATYYYKVSMYHSISAVESALSDAIPGGGFTRRQVGNIIDEILQEVSDPSEVHVTRGELLGYFNDVNDDLTTNVVKPYDFLRTRTTLTRTANRNYIDFPTDSNGYQSMWKFERMDYEFTDATTDPDTDNTSTITVMGDEEFRNTYSDNTISSTTVSDAKPERMCLDTSVNRFRFSQPFATTLAGVFYLYYYKYFTQLDSEGDIIETPTPKIYKLYCKAAYYNKRSLADVTLASMASKFEGQYALEKSKYTGQNRKDIGTKKSFRSSNSITKSYRR